MFGKAGKQSDAAERLMSSAKSYLSLMQSMMSFAAGRDASALNVSSWLDAMRGGMGMPGFDASSFGKIPGFDPAMFAKMPGFDAAMFANLPGFDGSLANNPMARALRDISGQGIKGFQQLAEGAAPMLQQMQQEGISWLKAPAFGYMREHQEHYQKMALAFVDFQQATKKYNALIMKSAERSFEILEGKLAERSEPGRQIDSVRGMYDLWVDAAEEAYAEIALSEEFQKVYGDVVNSQMRVRSQLQQEVERIGVDLGMPTRTELNSVHKRLHDLRREFRGSQESSRGAGDDGRDAEIAAMRAEIDDLRRLVANLTTGPAPPRASIPAVKKTPAARKRRPARRKRVAAKRAHVATKSTVLIEPIPPMKPTAMRKATTAIKRRQAASRRPPGRSARPQRIATAVPKASRPQNAAATGVSFADAIASMRSELSNGARKAKAARMVVAVKTSAKILRAKRSK